MRILCWFGIHKWFDKTLEVFNNAKAEGVLIAPKFQSVYQCRRCGRFYA